MILVVDIGNTHATLCLIEGDRVAYDWRLSSRTDRPWQEMAVMIRGLMELDGVSPDLVRASVIGSVVTHLTPTFERALEKLFGRSPLVVTGHTPMPVKNGYADPGQVGVDRLANAVGGIRLYGAPLIVVDFGTAITFDVISRDRVYLGGVILPGPELMAQSLGAGASQLPRITLSPPPETVIGRTTRDSIASGLIHGVGGAVDALVARIREELKEPDCPAIATGGRAGEFMDVAKSLEKWEPFLTLLGLRDIQAHGGNGSVG